MKSHEPKPLRYIDRTQWFGKMSKGEVATRMRWYQTATERKASSQIKEICLAHGLHYKAQVVLCGYIVDFFIAKLKLVIEVDGPFHDDPKRQEADRQRDAVLCRASYAVHRVSYKAIDKGPKAAFRPLARIIAANATLQQHKQSTDEGSSGLPF